MTEEQKDDASAFMKIPLNDDNFQGEIVKIYDLFIEKLKEFGHHNNKS